MAHIAVIQPSDTVLYMHEYTVDNFLTSVNSGFPDALEWKGGSVTFKSFVGDIVQVYSPMN